MNYIVFDLEATCWQGSPASFVQETIEIGAFKINGYGEVTGRFGRFIKPVLHPRLSAFCQELTSIQQSDVERASGFVKIIEEFQDWAEVFDEDYLLCSWGNFDKKLLHQDCLMHDVETDWLEEHINLKQQYKEIKRLDRSRGLKWAVEKEGFEFTGTHHRGIDDAANLAKVFIKYLDEWRW